MTSIDGKVALITGGSKGIGYGIAQALLENGVKVAITSRSLKAAEDAAARLSESGAEVVAIEADVRDMQAQKAAVAKVVSKWGQLDILVANAGVGNFGSIETFSDDLWHETLDINLTGVYNSIKSAVEPLKDSKGYIFTISSLAGTNFFAGGFAYNATKFGLVGMTQAIMLDLRQYGIKVTTIMPGSVSSHFNNRTPGTGDSWKIQPSDIGQMITDLLHMNSRTLPSKVEVRPTTPPVK